MANEFTIDVRSMRGVARRLEMLPDEVGKVAAARALNAVTAQGRTQMARQISREFRITVSQARQRLEIRKASAKGADRLVAILEASTRGKGRSMNLIHFVERKVTLAQARRRRAAGEGGQHRLRHGGTVQQALQLRFQIKRTGGPKMKPGAFIANQGRTVFIREGRNRKPIKALSTIDVPSMFNARRINEVVRRLMRERFPDVFKREARHALTQWAKKQ
jgi:hypothetical protein